MPRRIHSSPSDTDENAVDFDEYGYEVETPYNEADGHQAHLAHTIDIIDGTDITEGDMDEFFYSRLLFMLNLDVPVPPKVQGADYREVLRMLKKPGKELGAWKNYCRLYWNFVKRVEEMVVLQEAFDKGENTLERWRKRGPQESLAETTVWRSEYE
ncbi:hypothetical protein BDD12DRAFT_893051 [Trichophaea hybrida]|nr:hypothetical protein BDD12DRAFT_893051 [Trichophaea hybrida]